VISPIVPNVLSDRRYILIGKAIFEGRHLSAADQYLRNDELLNSQDPISRESGTESACSELPVTRKATALHIDLSPAVSLVFCF
jgi:hypothetical protein